MTGVDERTRRERVIGISGRTGAWQTQKRIAGRYPACQLLYWYRSNEMWKSVERYEKKGACVEPPTLCPAELSGAETTRTKQNRKG
jgi:hypothetical protein